MNLAFILRPRTQAIHEGKITVGELPIKWVQGLSSHERHRRILAGELDGGEMSISAFMQAKSQGAPLWALPIFLKRGLVHRSLYCRADSALTAPGQLKGKRIGLVSYESSMAVWVRGLLNAEYYLARADPMWVTLKSTSKQPGIESTAVALPPKIEADKIRAWEELDGYAKNLDHRERFLFFLLENKELDAVISYQARIASSSIRPFWTSEDDLWSNYHNKRIYPINHLFVLHQDLFTSFPMIGGALVSTFKKARQRWSNYLSRDQRSAMHKELQILGWDPFACELGEIEKATLETFMEYLLSDKMIAGKIPIEQLFYQCDEGL